MIDGADLDHIAVAVETRADVWPRYAGDLGGAWLQGGPNSGFSWAQVRFANGMIVEVLEPYGVEENDFLRRFLDRRGPGPHHLTYKVTDIHAAIAAAEAAGYPAVSVNVDVPWWKEAFLHPKFAPGIVIQLAQPGDDPDNEEGLWDEPVDTVPQTEGGMATLLRIVHAVPDLAAGTSLFVDVLGGAIVDEGEGRADLAWPGPGRVTLVTPQASPDAAAWIGDRPGRVHHVAFVVPAPEAIANAVDLGDGVYEVSADDNYGVRLRLAAHEEVLLASLGGK